MSQPVNITYVNGDIFESKLQTITNTINCVGVMGKGLALEFKKRYPEMFEDYKRRCQAGEVRIGEPYIYKASTPFILNFPTKDHWRNPSYYISIEQGLDYLLTHYECLGITSLAVPALGCKNGGLDWTKVKVMIESKLGRLPIPVEVYPPK